MSRLRSWSSATAPLSKELFAVSMLPRITQLTRERISREFDEFRPAGLRFRDHRRAQAG